MSGQSSGRSVAGARADAMSVCERGGISDSETSAIGGMGRKGGAAEGPEVAPHHNIAEEFMSRMGGNATTGTTGYNSGFGKTS